MFLLVIGLIDIIYSAYKEIIEGDKKAVSPEQSEQVGEAVRRVQISL